MARNTTPDTPTDEFLTTAMRRWRTAKDGEPKIREAMLRDMEFYASEQWPSNIKSDRRTDGRPTLTMNRLPQFVRQVTNQQRALRQGVQVTPMDGEADVATAEAIQGVIRAIENNSDADIAYSTACEHQCIIGRGWWRLLTEWSEDDHFQQNIAIREIPNPFSVYPDPASIRKDGSDIRYLFILDDIPKDEFKDRFGEEAYTTYGAFESKGDKSLDWMPEGRCRTAEDLYKEITYVEVAQLKLPAPATPEDVDPQTGEPTQSQTMQVIDVPMSSLEGITMPEDWKILSKRKVEQVTVKWARITPTQVLEGNDECTGGREFPSKYIPVVQVLGDDININGRRDLRGMVRDAQDPQRMYSFWASALTEIIALTPRAPYIGVEGQFSGHETKWNNANRKSYAYLEVKPISVGGQPVGLPQRQQFEPAIQAIVQAFQLADNDLKAVMGLYDASLGAHGPEQSGTAILARQRQGELGNSNYLDNLSRSIRYTGRIMLDMIPRVLTPIRIMRILGMDNEDKKVLIHNGAPSQDVEQAAALQGIKNIYDISVGRYDIVMESGPSYASRRKEAVAAMLELIKAQPDLAQLIGDLIVKNMDWPDAPEVAARIRRTIPPNVLVEGGPGRPGVPPEVQEEMEKLKAELQDLKAGVAVDKMKIESNEKMKRQELEVRERIASMQAEAMLIQTHSRLNADRTSQQIEQEIDRINTTIQRQHEETLARLDHHATLTDLDSTERTAAADREAELEMARLAAEQSTTESE